MTRPKDLIKNKMKDSRVEETLCRIYVLSRRNVSYWQPLTEDIACKKRTSVQIMENKYPQLMALICIRYQKTKLKILFQAILKKKIFILCTFFEMPVYMFK